MDDMKGITLIPVSLFVCVVMLLSHSLGLSCFRIYIRLCVGVCKISKIIYTACIEEM